MKLMFNQLVAKFEHAAVPYDVLRVIEENGRETGYKVIILYIGGGWDKAWLFDEKGYFVKESKFFSFGKS